MTTITNLTMQIEELATRFQEADGDKPLVNYIAKDLKRLCDDLIKLTTPGAGEFKWSAKTVKALVKPSPSKHQKHSLLVSSDVQNRAWHGDGAYMKRGDVPKRMGDLDRIILREGQLDQVIPNDRSNIVTVTGAADEPGHDALRLSNGALVDRIYLTYVMDGHTDVTLTQADPLHAICVMVGGEVVGLVMPIRPMVKK